MLTLRSRCVRISDVLAIGYCNRQPRGKIAGAIGAESDRAVRNALAFDRLDGITVLPDGKGNYFIPDFNNEAEREAAFEFWAKQEASATSILTAVAAMRAGYGEWLKEQAEKGGTDVGKLGEDL